MPCLAREICSSMTQSFPLCRRVSCLCATLFTHSAAAAGRNWSTRDHAVGSRGAPFPSMSRSCNAPSLHVVHILGASGARSLRTPQIYNRGLFCGSPNSSGFRRDQRTLYPPLCSVSSVSWRKRPPLLRMRPQTFSKTKALGCAEIMNLVDSLKSFPRGSSSPLASWLLRDHGWHAGPAT